MSRNYRHINEYEKERLEMRRQDNFMNNVLSVSISDIFNEINRYIFKEENVDVNHVYIDGTKIAEVYEIYDVQKGM